MNPKIEQIGSKSKVNQKRLTGIPFCAAYTIREDPAEPVHFASPKSSLS